MPEPTVPTTVDTGLVYCSARLEAAATDVRVTDLGDDLVAVTIGPGTAAVVLTGQLEHLQGLVAEIDELLTGVALAGRDNDSPHSRPIRSVRLFGPAAGDEGNEEGDR